MSSSIGRIALTGLGYVIGGAFGMPWLGAAIGGAVGSLLFPQQLPGVSGPRLSDQQLTTSTEGTPIPLVYGTHVVAGNIIWAAPLEEVENTDEVGGKGGPTQEVTNYTYFLSHAVGLCEGVITGIPRIWENGKLVYDRRAQQEGESDNAYTQRLAASDEYDESFTIYFGDETQEADPLMESFEGVGEVTAHRGLAYVVFERKDVTNTGGRPPQYQFEVTRAELVYTPTTELASDALYPWIENAVDPRQLEGDARNDHEYSIAGVSYDSSFGTVYSELETIAGYTLNSDLIGFSLFNSTENEDATWGGLLTFLFTEIQAGEKEVVFLHYNRNSVLTFVDRAGATAASDCVAIAATGLDTGDDPIWFSGVKDDGSTYNTLVGEGNGEYGTYRVHQQCSGVISPPLDSANGEQALNTCDDVGFTECGIGFNNAPVLGFWPDQLIRVRRVPRQPNLPGEDLPDWPVDPDDYWWDPDTGEIYSKQPWVQVEGDYLWLNLYAVSGSPTEVVRYPLGPVLHVDDPLNTEAFWTAAKNAAVLAGYTVGATFQADGLGGVDTFPRKTTYAWTRTYTAITYADYEGTTVGAIVRAQCERSSLVNETDFDVSTLTEVVHGYKVERMLSGRDIIEPLRQYSFFDGVETDKIRFPLRGGAIVATLTDDDLGAHEPGSTPPPMVTTQSIEDVELPYAIRLRYADTDNEYMPGMQPASRKVTAGLSATDIETTIAMDATAAAQRVDVILQESWMRRQSHDLPMGPHMLALTAADPILIPLRGETQRVIITEETRALPGIIEAKASRDDASIYTSNATGVAGGAGEQTLTPIGDTDLIIIDGPALTSSSNDAGVFLAHCGASDRWRGYGLFESTDEGENYSRIAAYTLPSTMGTLIDAIPEGPAELWDYANEFTVAMDHGTLESRTQDALTQGANAAFVGADGRWEVIQFASAVAEGIDGEGRTIYRLSTLLRGRQGTEHAIGRSQAGDRFALCITTERLSMEVARIGIPRLFKAVSFGRTSESGPTQTFTPQGVALKPYAPTLPESQRDGGGNLDIYAVRRTRISGEWMDSDYVPLNEEIEAYEVDILDEGSPETVLRTLSGTSFPIEYSAADQTTDFGSPQGAITVRIYQISTAVGRGYPTEATL